MRSDTFVHVIDGDYRRRARISNHLISESAHVELYENSEEFSCHVPKFGIVFAADESSCHQAQTLLALMRRHGCILPLVLYSEHPTPAQIVRAMLDGALDYLEWPFDTNLLNASIDHLSAVEGPRLHSERAQAEAKGRIAALTAREAQVLQLLVAGLSNKDMARELGISRRTVEIHRGNMMRKISAQSAADAVRLGLYAGLYQQAVPRLRLQQV